MMAFLFAWTFTFAQTRQPTVTQDSRELIKQIATEALEEQRKQEPRWLGIPIKEYFALGTLGAAILATIAALVTIRSNRRIFEERLAHDRIEAARSRIEDRFTDVQNRLSSVSEQEKVNAIHSLVDLARALDPSKEEGTPPSESANPMLRPVIRRLSSTLVLEESISVRKAAEVGLVDLAEFGLREVSDLKWKEVSRTSVPTDLLQNTRFLINSLGRANREAYSRWRAAWAQFVAAHHALGVCLDVRSMDEDVIVLMPSRPDDFDAGEFFSKLESYQVPLRTWMFPARDETGETIIPSDELWAKATNLCPFLHDQQLFDYSNYQLTIDVLARVQIDREFQREFARHYEYVSAMKASTEFRTNELVDKSSYLAVCAQNLISTRDAIVACVCGEHLAGLPLPDTIERTFDLGRDDHFELDYDAYEVLRTSRTDLDLLEQIYRCDLNNAFLVGARFSGYLLPCVLLSRASLIGSRFDTVRGVEPWLRLADMEGSRLEYCNFIHAEMTLTSLHGASVTMCCFPFAHAWMLAISSSKLSNLSLRSGKFSEAGFANAVMTACDFRGSDLSECSFEGMDLRDHRVDYSCLREAECKGASVELDQIISCDGKLKDGWQSLSIWDGDARVHNPLIPQETSEEVQRAMNEMEARNCSK